MSPFAHAALVFSYSLLAALLGMRAGALLPALDGTAMGYATTAVLFLLFALIHEIVARRMAIGALRTELLDVRKAERARESQLDHARREIAVLRREVQESGGANDEMELVRTLLGQLADRIGERLPAAPAAIGGTAGSDVAEPETTLAGLRQAIEDNRVDLYLQPIVSLPQRRTRYYECFSRIRLEDGTVLAPDRYLALAMAEGLLTTIDNLLLFRCVQLVRRVRRRNRNVGFFINMTMASLQDDDFVTPFLDFLDQNPELSDHIVFEFGADEFRRAPAGAQIVLSELRQRRYGFSIDRVEALDLDPEWLAERGVRVVKVAAPLLLDAPESRLKATRFRMALDRNGIDLVAEKVESEPAVLDLLDLRVDLGQGWIFGEPRRSREES